MAENVVARDLMLIDVTEIRGDRSLGDAMHALVELQVRPSVPNVLIVVDADGRYVGLLTARLLFKSLLTLWMPGKAVREDAARLATDLLAVVRDRGRLQVQDTLVHGLPTVAPDERLLPLIEASCERRLEFVPVVEDGRALGVVPVSEIFKVAAGLALTPEHEGIRTDDG